MTEKQMELFPQIKEASQDKDEALILTIKNIFGKKHHNFKERF